MGISGLTCRRARRTAVALQRLVCVRRYCCTSRSRTIVKISIEDYWLGHMGSEHTVPGLHQSYCPVSTLPSYRRTGKGSLPSNSSTVRRGVIAPTRTRSPTSYPLTPEPSSWILPTASCPRVRPHLTGYSPLTICTSVPQMVVSVISMTASPARFRDRSIFEINSSDLH